MTYTRKYRHHKKKQSLYKMRGCYKGGVTLAYPSNNVPTVPNPHLAYTGRGGSSYMKDSPANYPIPQNTNGADVTRPSTGPPSNGYNFLNYQGPQRGGCGPCMAGTALLLGGSSSHRISCKCSACKKGGTMKGGNAGIPYPDGTTGNSWSVNNLPGESGINGDANFYKLNTYPTDISRQMIATGANRPFVVGGKGRRHRRTRKTKRHHRNMKGGSLSNFVIQDLINVGRQLNYDLGYTYNTLAGYKPPVNPMPWEGQFGRK